MVAESAIKLKTEKTHAGTLVEIGIQRRLALADGDVLDYSIAGIDVDCKFSHLVGLLRARPGYLGAASNRDLKRSLSEPGRAAITWLFARSPLQENALVRMTERDVAAVFAPGSGQQRVNELFRRAQRRRVSRTVVATVAKQDDYMKRVRAGGGARDQLRGEGIVIFGDYAGDQALATALGLPRPPPASSSAPGSRRAQANPAGGWCAWKVRTGRSPAPPTRPSPPPTSPVPDRRGRDLTRVAVGRP